MDLNFVKLKEALKDVPKFRIEQAIKAVYVQSISDWSEATVFSNDLREKLRHDCPLIIEAKLDIAKDGNTVKALFEVPDGAIEAVLMRHQGRNTVCVSTQIGCAMACEFCLTGTMGFKRNLSMDEMINQVLYFNRYLKAKNERVNNVVFMGMGEPFNNYDAVMMAIEKLNDPGLFAIGARHISISTSGIVLGIKKLAKEKLQVNLSVSLHAASNQLRDELMPINQQYSIEVLLKAVRDYIEKTKRRVMIEYIMLKDVNDSPRDADMLAKVLQKNLKDLYFVNLIKYNQTGKFEPSEKRSINIFKRILSKSGISVVERFRFGQDIKGACGQLATRKNF